MSDKPREIERDEVDYVSLSQGVTRAHAVTLIRGGKLEMPGDWKDQLDELRKARPANDDALSRELEHRKKLAGEGDKQQQG